MSTREMFIRDIEIMPDDLFGVYQAIWTMFKKKAEDEYYYAMPNAETIAALEDTDYNTYHSVEEQLAALSRFDNEES
jgi:hypothetical protein